MLLGPSGLIPFLIKEKYLNNHSHMERKNNIILFLTFFCPCSDIFHGMGLKNNNKFNTHSGLKTCLLRV